MYPQFNNPYQVPTVSTLPGKIVNRETDIAVTDVPMGNKPSVFVLSDGSSIYLKFWTPSGLIETVKFVPDVPKVKEPEFQISSLIPTPSPENTKDVVYATAHDVELLNKRLDEMFQAINNITNKPDKLRSEQRGENNE